jgi:hypothetical protein
MQSPVSSNNGRRSRVSSATEAARASGLLCKMCVQTHRCNLAKLGKLLVMVLCAIVCNRCGTLTSVSTLRGWNQQVADADADARCRLQVVGGWPYSR